MKKFISLKEIIIFLSMAVACVLLATLVPWGKEDVLLTIVCSPFSGVGVLLRMVGQKADGAAIFLYILFCLLPLVFPLVRIIRQKKFGYRNLLWLAPTAFLFAMMYFFINPYKMPFVYSSIAPSADLSQSVIDSFRNITLIAFATTFIAICFVCLLVEFLLVQRKNDSKNYHYARALLIFFIVLLIIKVFLLDLAKIKIDIVSILANNSSDNISKKNAIAVSVFMKVFKYILNLVPAFFGFLLYLQGRTLIGDLQSNMFVQKNITSLKTIMRTCVILIFLYIGVMIFLNILSLCLSNIMLVVNYDIQLPLGMLLVISLIMVFSKILIKAIEVNEENKLVI